MTGNRSSGTDRGFAEERQVDVRRYLGALRRHRRLIISVVVLMTGLILALSLILPKSYKATATIVLVTDTGALTAPDADTIQRRLATVEILITNNDVLDAAEEQVPGGDLGSIESSVDPAANLINVSASGDTPEQAAESANAVTTAFLDIQAQLARESLVRARESLEQSLAELENDPAASESLIAGLRDQISSLLVQEQTAGEDLRFAQRAEPPSAAASPRPVRNTVLGLFASLFIGIVLALGRDQLRPGISGPRELSRLMGGVPVLSGIPYVRRGLRRRRTAISAIEHEAYQTLRAAIQVALPPRDHPHVILVSSALDGEGKTTVTGRLGRALAVSGHRTLLISADLRWPDLHVLFSLPLEPGLTDVLRVIRRAGVSERLLPAIVHQVELPGTPQAGEGDLHVLTTGSKPTDPASLLSSNAFTEFLRYVRSFEYDYVLIDGTPMLGLADVQPLAQQVDSMLIVARLERLTAEKAIDFDELISRLEVRPLGLVVIGARAEFSPYYLGERPVVKDEPSEARPRAVTTAERASRPG